MKKYQTSGSVRIMLVPVERDTAQSVWINGRRWPKSGFDSFFDTFEQAKTHCICRAERQLQIINDRIEQLLRSRDTSERHLSAANAMTEKSVEDYSKSPEAIQT